MSEDRSLGYDAVAAQYIAVRSRVGCEVVAAWAKGVARGGSVLDVGAGSGEPMIPLLQDAGLEVFAVDASPTMAAAFKARFPNLPIVCEPAEDSAFFNRKFDGIMAIGLVFLLSEIDQRRLFQSVARALKPGGGFLFSAPEQACSWADVLTGQPSTSLGIKAYRRILANEGLDVIGGHFDKGGSHYCEARKQAT
ncbi:class I SAM-dependent methyltransferase [Algiphilus sp.]|uniref:class I SAM-dependent methyltransferase n=1 Tax=Algiphilus sp. TaxID=1872431 RepID=UPI0032F05301